MAGEDSAGIVPVWDEKSSSLDSFEERIRRYVKGTKKDERYLCANRILGRFNPDRLPYKTIMAKVTEDELEEKDDKVWDLKPCRKRLDSFVDSSR